MVDEDDRQKTHKRRDTSAHEAVFWSTDDERQVATMAGEKEREGERGWARMQDP